jgi:hypothetical protein
MRVITICKAGEAKEETKGMEILLAKVNYPALQDGACGVTCKSN